MRRSLPYAWSVVSSVAAEVAEPGVEVADHERAPPGGTERGRTLNQSPELRNC